MLSEITIPYWIFLTMCFITGIGIQKIFTVVCEWIVERRNDAE